MTSSKRVAIVASALFVFAGVAMLGIHSGSTSQTIFETFFDACGIYSFGMAGLVWVLYFTSARQAEKEKEVQERVREAIEAWNAEHPDS